MKNGFFRAGFACLLGIASFGAAQASTFSIRIVADNDFAIFSGTATGVNHLLYQNNYNWYNQIPNLSTLSFNLDAGDTTFYVLGLGGNPFGSPPELEENISGTINGVDMTDPSVTVTMSSDIQASLFPLSNYIPSVVESGLYDASLSDVQAAFPYLTWGAPTLNSSQTVIVAAAPNGIGFSFDSTTAHLFAFSAADVGVEAVPEPSSIALTMTALGSLLLLRGRSRKRSAGAEERRVTFA